MGCATRSIRVAVNISMLTIPWESVVFWRRGSVVLAILSAALLVAATIAREPPDFSVMPIVAVVRDDQRRPVWEIRLARAAHQIAADSLRPQHAPPDHAYQLWLLVPGSTPRPLGLLPQSERKRIAVTPENARLLGGDGALDVTLEPTGGSPAPGPSGPVLFRVGLEGSG
jgi:anti-sigma-K factor RskA